MQKAMYWAPVELYKPTRNKLKRVGNTYYWEFAKSRRKARPRRIEGGEPTLLAATNGSHEIGFAVIATTLVLVSVILPISFMI